MSSTIYGRVGGAIGGYSVSCITTPTSVSGRVGGAVIGGDLDLDIEAPPGRVSGRVGGTIIGRSVSAVRGLLRQQHPWAHGRHH